MYINANEDVSENEEPPSPCASGYSSAKLISKLILRVIKRETRFSSKLRRSEETLKVLCSKFARDLPSFLRLDSKYLELSASSIPVDGVERTTTRVLQSRGTIVLLVRFVKLMRLFLGR
jgi:hypothetical protein